MAKPDSDNAFLPLPILHLSPWLAAADKHYAKARCRNTMPAAPRDSCLDNASNNVRALHNKTPSNSFPTPAPVQDTKSEYQIRTPNVLRRYSLDVPHPSRRLRAY